MKKTIFICVQKDILNAINWVLRDFEKSVFARNFDNINNLKKSDILDVASVLILDSIVNNETSKEFIKELKSSNPNIKILLIVSVGTTKEEIIEIIKMRIVNGVLIRPFTAEQLSEYIYKLCDIKKPSTAPWYMQGTCK